MVQECPKRVALLLKVGENIATLSELKMPLLERQKKNKQSLNTHEYWQSFSVYLIMVLCLYQLNWLALI